MSIKRVPRPPARPSARPPERAVRGAQPLGNRKNGVNIDIYIAYNSDLPIITALYGISNAGDDNVPADIKQDPHYSITIWSLDVSRWSLDGLWMSLDVARSP